MEDLVDTVTSASGYVIKVTTPWVDPESYSEQDARHQEALQAAADS